MRWRVWYDVRSYVLGWRPKSPGLELFEKTAIDDLGVYFRYFEVIWTSGDQFILEARTIQALGCEFIIDLVSGTITSAEFLYGNNIEPITEYPTYTAVELPNINKVRLKINPESETGKIRLSNGLVFRGSEFVFKVNPHSQELIPVELKIEQYPTTFLPVVSYGGKTYPTISFRGVIVDEEQLKNFYRWSESSLETISRLFTDISVYDGILLLFRPSRTQKSYPELYVEYEASFLVTSLVEGSEKV